MTLSQCKEEFEKRFVRGDEQIDPYFTYNPGILELESFLESVWNAAQEEMRGRIEKAIKEEKNRNVYDDELPMQPEYGSVEGFRQQVLSLLEKLK